MPANSVSNLVSGLYWPESVAVDGAGNVFFADTGNHAIKEWNATTGTVKPWSPGLQNPGGVAVDGAGNVYFSDYGNNTVEEWNATTHTVSTLVSTGWISPMALQWTGRAMSTSPIPTTTPLMSGIPQRGPSVPWSPRG